MPIKGYAGKIAYIDLDLEKVTEKPLDDQLATEYLGGRGFIAKILTQKLLNNHKAKIKCQMINVQQLSALNIDQGTIKNYFSFNFSWRFSLRISPKSDVEERIVLI